MNKISLIFLRKVKSASAVPRLFRKAWFHQLTPDAIFCQKRLTAKKSIFKHAYSSQQVLKVLNFQFYSDEQIIFLLFLTIFFMSYSISKSNDLQMSLVCLIQMLDVLTKNKFSTSLENSGHRQFFNKNKRIFLNNLIVVLFASNH